MKGIFFLHQDGSSWAQLPQTTCPPKRTFAQVGVHLEPKRSAPEALMPAIASLEDFKAAQKEGLSIYAMR